MFNSLKSEENGIRWNMHCQKNKQNNEYIMAVIECISSGMLSETNVFVGLGYEILVDRALFLSVCLRRTSLVEIIDFHIYSCNNLDVY